MLYLSVQLLFSMSNVLEYNSFDFCYSSKYLFAWEENFNHYLTSVVELPVSRQPLSEQFCYQV